MDFEKYYNIKSDGSYTIHFANSNGLTNSEIEIIFSAYGNVLSIDGTGDDHGLRFIRYRMLEEVERCLRGLSDQKTIRILPQKNKIQQKCKKENSSELYQKKNNDIKLANNSTGKNFKKHKKSGNISLNSTDQDKFGNQNDDTLLSDQFSDISSATSTESRHLKNKQNFKKKDSMPQVKQPMLQSHEYEDSAITTISTNSSILQNNIANIHLDDDMPNLIQEEKHSENKSVSQCSTTSILSKMGTVLAQDVIVGNIHKDFGIHYILHLLEAYNPISVSLMKLVPNTSIRYCHVYFKTPQDALAVEQKFDKYSLSGKHLIVLRCLRLIEEAMGL